MTIEFNCKFCGKILRTGDDKAGRQARCPSCGETIGVPDASTEAEADDDADVGGTPTPPSRSRGSSTAAAKARDYVDDYDEYDDEEGFEDEYDEYDDEYESPRPRSSGSRTKPCPVCGGPVKAREEECPHCGEDLFDERDRSRSAPVRRRGGRRTGSSSRDVIAGEIISDSWAIFGQEMGTLVGATLVKGIIDAVVQQVVKLGGFLIFALIAGQAAGGRGPQGPEASVALVVMSIAQMIIIFPISCYLAVGLNLVFYNTATGRGADFSDLFRGGPFWIRYTLASLLFAIMSFFGLLLLIIPGIIVALMFWPYCYALFHHDGSTMECLTDAKKVTDGHWGTIFVLALAAFGINILGVLMCCIGVLFTAPLTHLMFTVAYCRMANVRVDV